MFISNFLSLALLLSVKSPDGEIKNITVDPFKQDLFFSLCQTKSWNINKVLVLKKKNEDFTYTSPMQEDTSSMEMWQVTFFMGPKGTTVPTKSVSVRKNQLINLPICIDNNMIIFKIEIVNDIITTRSKRDVKKNNKREVTVQQTWDKGQYYQVIKDDEGVEISVRVEKQPEMYKKTKTTTPPVNVRSSTKSSRHAFISAIPTSSTTSSTTSGSILLSFFDTVPTAIDDNDNTKMSEDCEQYKNALEQMINWGFDELDRLRYGRIPSHICKNYLPSPHV